MPYEDNILTTLFGISPKLIERTKVIEEDIKEVFTEYEEIKAYNQYKVLKAMQECRLSDQHFQWTTGYGYNDLGRDKLEEIYAKVFSTEDAIVRPIIVNGTHALTLALSGVLSPGDEMVSVTGKPYDTLDELIGLRGDYHLSFSKLGISYKQVDFTPEGEVDFKAIERSVNEKTKLVYIQRSTGYSFRRAVDIETLEEIISLVKGINPNIICMIDNCYGEFLEKKEPTEVGADLMAGSLIKNPGGGLALAGGYIVGRKDLIEAISYRMTSPGIGKECGLTFGQSRTMFQGLFLAPHVVCEAMKGAVFCGRLFDDAGYTVRPTAQDRRSDIIQSVELGDPEKVLAFCRGVQAAAPVDSYVTPEAWDMPGYENPVVMAAGAFVQGSSIELSADAPIRPPYIVYFQGGLTYEHSKLGALKALQNIIDLK
ncbi:methionine gamma-lyase family protein [Alkaliphilus transvaalensis]|uniref:methionine gamma-lyase family protein n=1 Tax=Alkaliphilus transvaalensis TaxID=114628 RepID=UPI00047E6A40|nr:methionine gamma-lyase family protein [Alkaliphilus transvaalensis]